MLAIDIMLGMFSIGFLCWLVFMCAVYAAPLYVGALTCIGVWHHGVSGGHAALLGFGMGVAVLIVGRAVLTTTRVPAIRAAVGLLFAAPAAVAGYCMTLGLSSMGGSPGIWQVMFAVIGALFVGGTAWARLSAYAQ